MPPVPSSPRWIIAIKGEITDTQRCCDSLESAGEDLKSSIHKKSYSTDPSLPQYIDCIQNCLRKILQIWAKGQQNDTNKWNLCALSFSTSMVKMITCDHEFDSSKCYKLVGFILAKSSCMGESDPLFSFLDSCVHFLDFQISRSAILKPGISSFLPVYLHTIADIAMKQKSSRRVSSIQHDVICQSLQICLNPSILSATLAEVNSSSSTQSVVPSLGSPISNIVNASVAWALVAPTWNPSCSSNASRILALAMDGCCLFRLYHSIPRSLEMIAKNVNVVVSNNDLVSLVAMVDNLTLCLSSLATTLESEGGETIIQFINDLNSLGRISLYWAYEVSGKSSVSLLKTSKSTAASTAPSRAMQAACALCAILWDKVRKIQEEAIGEAETWKWALMRDTGLMESYLQRLDSGESAETVCSDLSTDAVTMLSTSVPPASALSGVDKTLLSKLCVGCAVLNSLALQSASCSPLSLSHNSCARLIGEFIPSTSSASPKSHIPTAELAAKLTVVCFQRAYLSSLELHNGVVLQLAAVGLRVLTVYADPHYNPSSSDPQLCENLIKYVSSTLNKLTGEISFAMTAEWVGVLDAMCACTLQCVTQLGAEESIALESRAMLTTNIADNAVNLSMLLLKFIESEAQACRLVMYSMCTAFLLICDQTVLQGNAMKKIAGRVAKLIVYHSHLTYPLSTNDIKELTSRCPLLSEIVKVLSTSVHETQSFARVGFIDLCLEFVMIEAKLQLESIASAGTDNALQEGEKFIQQLTDALTQWGVCDLNCAEVIRLQALSELYWFKFTSDIVWASDTPRHFALLADLVRVSGADCSLPIAKPQKKSSSKRSKTDTDENGSDYGVTARRFKASMLCLQWSYVLSSQSSTDGAHLSSSSQASEVLESSHVLSHLANALMCWHDLSEKRRPTLTGLLHYHSDSLLLMHYLSIYGYDDAAITVLETWCSIHVSCMRVDKRDYSSASSLLLNIKCTLAIASCINASWRQLNRVCHVHFEDTDWSQAVMQFVHSVAEQLQHSNGHPGKSRSAESFAEYCDRAERTIKIVKAGKQTQVYCWLAVLHSKLCVLLGGDHSLALSWAKKSLVQLKSSSDPGGSAGSGREDKVDVLAMEMEAMLAIADVHEMTGSIDKSLTYLAEAKALCHDSQNIYKKIYSLHAVRIWMRLGSSRYSAELDSIRSMDSCESETVSSTLGPNISEMITRCGEAIAGIITSGALPADILDSLSYRCLSQVWDALTSSATVKYHTAMPATMRNNIRLLCSERFQSSHMQNKAMCSGLGDDRNADILGRVIRKNDRLVCGEWFDVVRDVRRRLLSDALVPRLEFPSGLASSTGEHTELSSYFPQLCFTLGAASCGTSVECSLENKSEATNERFAGLSATCELVSRACAADREANIRIHKLLSQRVSNMADEESCSVYAFVSLDHSAKRLLLGRKDSSPCPLVVSLPLYDAFVQCVSDWTNIIDCNRSQLNRTSSAVEVSSWGTSEKVSWWNDRDQLDRRVKKFLEDMEFMLGPWRCLLSPCSTTIPSTIRDTCTIKLLTLFHTHSSMKEPKKKAQKKGTHASTTAPAECIDTVVEGVIHWLSLFISPCNGLEKCERVAGLNDVLVCALSHFVDADADWTAIENESLQVSIALVDTYITSDEAVTSIGDEITAVLSSASGAKPKAINNLETLDAMRRRVVSLKVNELKAELKDLGQDVSGKKSDLSSRLVACLEAQMHQEEPQQDDERKASDTSGSSTHNISPSIRSSVHVTLILDESLQAIPWESIPLLRASSCSRVPSLSVLLYLLQSKPVSGPSRESSSEPSLSNKKSKVNSTSKSASSSKAATGTGVEIADHAISVARCWYTIDPDANLERTRETMMTFIEPFVAKWQWPGYAGQRPPEDVIRKFHESSELFVYCGHGSGEKLFDKGNKLRKLKCPAAMLWGCSSGALVRNGIHDPIGAAVSYLLSGAPWVIGNLWDVTDRDIDRLSVSCMEKVFDSNRAEEWWEKCGRLNVSLSLCDSREVCKLKSAVGSAAVMYGLPVAMKMK